MCHLNSVTQIQQKNDGAPLIILLIIIRRDKTVAIYLAMPHRITLDFRGRTQLNQKKCVKTTRLNQTQC
jgi:hypothetical protein